MDQKYRHDYTSDMKVQKTTLLSFLCYTLRRVSNQDVAFYSSFQCTFWCFRIACYISLYLTEVYIHIDVFAWFCVNQTMPYVVFFFLFFIIKTCLVLFSMTYERKKLEFKMWVIKILIYHSKLKICKKFERHRYFG